MNFEQNPSDSQMHGREVPLASLASDSDLIPPVTEDDKPKSIQLSAGGFVAWFAILVMTIGMMGLTAFAEKSADVETSNEASQIDLMPIQSQAKMMISVGSFAAPLVDTSEVDDSNSNDPETPDEATESDIRTDLDVGPYEQRLAFTILTSEIDGIDAALTHLETTDVRAKNADYELTENQDRLRATLKSLLIEYQNGDPDAKNVKGEEKEFLAEKLGWLGEIALVPEGTSDKEQRQSLLAAASQSTFTFFGALAAGGLMVFIGGIAAIFLIVLTIAGKLRTKFCNQTGRHNIYIETFAIWMFVFFGSQIFAPVVVVGFVGELSMELALGLSPILFFTSLITLAWPVIRGIPFTEVREDIGWKSLRPFSETGYGMISYIALLPVIFISLVVLSVVLLVSQAPPSADVFSSPAAPGHPIQEYVLEGSGLTLLLVYFTACVAAPIVEETMFRGVFYRHLRDLTQGSSRIVSVFVSCLVNGFIFAAIHPQGMMGVPMLMTLAIGFSLAREWRGSLAAPIFMHALNNAVVTTLLFLMM